MFVALKNNPQRFCVVSIDVHLNHIKETLSERAGGFESSLGIFVLHVLVDLKVRLSLMWKRLMTCVMVAYIVERTR